jgi:hypothetical protein
MKWGLSACVVFLFVASPEMARQSQLEVDLNTGSHSERVQKLISLGATRQSAESAADGDLKWRKIRNGSPHEMSLLFSPCGSLDDSFLYLLNNTDRGWRVVDEVGFDCHYDDNVSFELISLRSPKVDDVLVHHECEGHGTGFPQQNFNVFAIVSSKFRIVLNTEEIVKVNDWPGATELEQESAFSTVPISGDGSGTIVETRNVKKNGKLTVEKREFRWSQARFRFVPSRFVKINQSR